MVLSFIRARDRDQRSVVCSWLNLHRLLYFMYTTKQVRDHDDKLCYFRAKIINIATIQLANQIIVIEESWKNKLSISWIIEPGWVGLYICGRIIYFLLLKIFMWVCLVYKDIIFELCSILLIWNELQYVASEMN